MAKLQDKVAIVTGGAGGIGSAIVKAYVKEGAKVVIGDIDEKQGKKLVKEFNSDDVTFVHTDLTDRNALGNLVKETVEKYGQLDILVNNAHATKLAPFEEITETDLDLSMKTGFYATFYLSQLAIPHLRKTKGTIINFGSGAAMKGDAEQGAYVAAKEAIRGITRVMATELGKDGINVNVISPIAYTPGVEAWKKEYPEYYERVVQNIPLQRFGDIEEDIAPVAVFLASEDSKYITGQTIMVDGGSIKLY